MMADNESDKNIETWKIKKLIKALEAARGNDNSMTSLIMHPCSFYKLDCDSEKQKIESINAHDPVHFQKLGHVSPRCLL